MLDNRVSMIAGGILIALGAIFLANLFLPGAWATILIGVGIFFLILSISLRKGEYTTTGTINLTLGSILLYQSISEDWVSWYYLWPLVFTAVGSGMLLFIPFHPKETWSRGRYFRTGLSFFMLGLVTTAVLWIFRTQLNWPIILWGMGAFFTTCAITSSVGPLVIPGAVLGGIGGLLAYQTASGDWNSWSYTWSLIPGFVGLGLFFGFLQSRVMRVIGLSMLGWSMVVFTIFGLVFAREGEFAQYWPLALILAGVIILAQTLVIPRQAKRR